MSGSGTLFELIQQLETFEDREGSQPLVLYARDGADAERRSPALVCARSEGTGVTCPLDPSLTEVLSVAQAREAIAVWSAWRGGLSPSPEDRYRTVMFYSRHGAFFPLESEQEGM